MSVQNVIHRIHDIQRQFGSLRARAGYADAAAAVDQTPGAEAGSDGVIVGRMGHGPTVQDVGLQQHQLSLQPASTQVANLASPLPTIEFSSDYGMRRHPVHGDVRMHHGIDLDADSGTPISSISDGIVTFAGERGGYGNLVVVDHGGGFETRYAHQANLTVTEGDLVHAGDVIGYVGSTGVSTGPHLHFEVRRDGESVDPEPWLRVQ